MLALSLIGDNAGRSSGDWVTTLLMLDTFADSPDPAGLTHMWSLAVEVSFYLVLPLLMLVGVGRRFSVARLAARAGRDGRRDLLVAPRRRRRGSAP